ncbi:hypothetical protein [Polyangium sp. y55x31]|uniref:hypothetical protein n=1 Tax=Polyangium sp. y55x31 TaxID=3042688 RepID=UPI002482BE05|nr:hypothetical protein [Polyangium sp. y55x31]MDI1478527.1 hypothetical protein [Polyangium sp. y55x31]
MTTGPMLPYAGPLDVSLADVKDDLFDLPPGGAKGFRGVQPGIEDVVHELAASFPLLGESAGISPKLYERFVAETKSIDALLQKEMLLEKLLEVTRESRRLKTHQRENTIARIVDITKSTAQRTRDKALLAPFEKTLRYNAQIAVKGAKTRRKNQAAKTEASAARDRSEG